MQTILIVEDEEKIASLLNDYLKQANYETHIINDGALATQWIKENKPDLILLDIMLPNKDGLTICKEVRKFSELPIIMVTARIEEIDRLLGLELGADDYICKPFSPREVVARVGIILRRIRNNHSNQTQDSEIFSLDEGKHTVRYREQQTDLTSVEFQLLKLMASEPGHIFSRQKLMDRIYQDNRIVSDRTIDSHIKKLRKKLTNTFSDDSFIHSVYGVGYKFELPTN